MSSGTLSSTSVGTVRVCVGEIQGVICDKNWGFPEASAACRAAGFSYYGAVPISGQYVYSSSHYTPIMSNVSCSGNETRLTQCSYGTASCSSYSYAGVACQSPTISPDYCTHGHVQLSGSSLPWQGRVEICINNLWSTVCDGGWSSDDAKVVCTQIGYLETGAQAIPNSFFGGGTAPTLIDSVLCYGSEPSLLDCTFSLSYSSCSSSNTAGVICEVPCTDDSVQLISSSGSSGVVKVCDSSNTYLICDYGWDYVDASVACKSVGLSPYGAVRLLDQSVSSTSGYSFLSYFSCNGSESVITDCESLPQFGSCQNNLAGIHCQAFDTVPDNCIHGLVRLVGGTNIYEGNVEVCINNVWGTICDVGWSNDDAKVACAQAGYPGPGAVSRYNSYFGIGTNRPIFLSSLGCSELEPSLLDCRSTLPSSSCDSLDIAGVVCEGPCTDGSARLLQYSGSLNSTSGGVVQLCFDQKKFLVCDHGWDFVDSSVLCQSLGYSPYGAVALHNQQLSSTVYNGLALLSYVKCTGTESNFTDCEYDVLYSGNCKNNFAGVYCQAAITADNCTHGDIRLVGGVNEYEGRVEVCVNGVWGTVCDNGWSSSDAFVVCTQLGYAGNGATPQFNARFGLGSGPILLSGVDCDGSQSSILECGSSLPSFCSHFDDAGVVCKAPCVDGSVQLVDSAGSPSSSTTGVVSICNNDNYTTESNSLVCDFGWNFVAASVACKSAGFSPYGAVSLVGRQVSPSYGYTFVGFVNCNGSEMKLSECAASSYSTPCSYSYAGVFCQDLQTVSDKCTHGDVRLTGGSTDYEGAVEICINSVWGTICDFGWTPNDAIVACAQAGYPGSGAISRINSYFGISNNEPMLLSGLGCSSFQSSLLDCSYTNPSSSCDQFDIAGVSCEAPCSEGSVQLLQYYGSSDSISGGVVQVCLNGTRFLVCDFGWDFLDSKVVCQSIGYSPYGATALHGMSLSFNIYFGLPLLEYVSCNGTESSLSECDYAISLSGNCNYFFAAVYCQDASVILSHDNCTHGDIRLIGGASEYEGRVEMCANNAWGTVCDSGWNTNDASVVCSQLGYKRASATAYYNAKFGAGSGPIVLSGLSCGGSESSVLECFSSIPSSSCDHSDDAGVTCEAPCAKNSIQLLQSSGNSGVVEICTSNSTFLICDYGWDYMDASVACKSVGLSPHGAVAIYNQYIAIVSDYTFLSYINCNGSESNLTECESEPRPTPCQYNYAGVSCQALELVPDNCTHGEIRLVRGFTDYEGNVEVCINAMWGAVCDHGWNSHDASVVCAQVGYPGPGAIPQVNSYYGVYNGPILISNVGCFGTESSLVDCSSGVPSSYCNKNDIAGVVCEERCVGGSVQLINDDEGSLSSTTYGAVRICNSNYHYFFVCEHGWDYKDASVACKSAGFSPYGAVWLNSQHIPSSSSYSYLTEMGCNGNESTLNECPSLLRTSPCYYDYAGVSCQVLGTVSDNCLHGDIRLVGGSTEYEGNVAVCVNGVWGTVCDVSWNTNDARVTCAQIGYPGAGAVARINSFFGAYNRPILLNSVYCNGSESSLTSCPSGPQSSSCDQYDIAGVSCEAPCSDGVKLLQVSGSLNDTSGGVVQLCFNETRFLICDDVWDFMQARILCQSIGYSPYGALPQYNQKLSPSAYNGLLVIGNFTCDEASSSLADCKYDVFQTEQCIDNFAGVYCQAADASFTLNNCDNGDIRLFGGSTIYEGTIELCANNVWGTVCDSGWSTNDAIVACSQLGYPGTSALGWANARFGSGSGPILLSDLTCTIFESSILECGSSPPSSFCDHSDDAGVTCEEPCEEGSVQLVVTKYGTMSNSGFGLVTICINSVKNVICDSSWDFKNARIACKSAGFSSNGAVPLRNQLLFSIPYSTFDKLSNVTCTGTESHLSQCDLGPTVGTCDDGIAGVSCQVSDFTNQITNCTDGDIRLVSGSSQYNGRVEICANSIWGTVCDDYWNTNDARVVCKQLGSTGSGATALRNSFFGSTTGPIMLNGLRCKYDDLLLIECISSDPLYCSHYEEAGVICEEPCMENGVTDLINYAGTVSDNSYGAIRLCINGSQAIICSSGWGHNEARIACQSAGYSPDGAVPISFYTRISNDPGVNLKCTGDELNLSECTVSNGSCSEVGYNAGVSCQPFNSTIPDNCKHGSVRLVDGGSELQGRVEICFNNVWGTVCDRDWSTIDAQVVCQSLGHSASGAVALHNGFYGPGSGPILLSGVNCSTGYESSLFKCTPTYAPFYCSHFDDAGVKCLYSSTSCSYGDIRLVGGSSQYEGRVEVCISNRWGTVCDDDWEEADAEVVCNQLGYPKTGAMGLQSAAYGSGTGPVYLNNVECTGTESTLLECQHSGIGSAYCSHLQDAGVKCQAVCPMEKESVNTELYIQWPQTEAGVKVTVLCPCDEPASGNYAARTCSEDMLTGASWEESNTANCSYMSYESLTLALCTLLTTSMDPQTKASRLKNLTTDPEQLKPIDISIAARVVSQLINMATINQQVRDAILDTVQNLLNADRAALATSEQESLSTSRLLRDLESLGSTLVIPDGQAELTLMRKTFALKAEDVVVTDFIGTTLSVTVSDGGSLTSNSLSSDNTNPTASISLPSQVVDNVDNDTVRIVFQTFLQDSFYQSQDPESYTGSKVNSIILLADVFSEQFPITVYGLSNPIILNFTKMRALETRQASQCVYWKNGGWSSEGCTVESDAEIVICTCSHLSSFSITTVDLNNSLTTATASVQIVSTLSSAVIVGSVFAVVVVIMLIAVTGTVIAILLIRKKHLKQKTETVDEVDLCIENAEEISLKSFPESTSDLTISAEVYTPEKQNASET